MDIALFKLVGITIAIVIISSVLMLFIGRYRKTGLWILTILFSIILLAACYYYYPRRFNKNYLSDTTLSSQVYFRQYADSLNFYIGATGNLKTIPDSLFCENYNSVTPENELKMGALLKNNKIGEYDFSYADSVVNLALQKKLRIRGHVLIWGKQSDQFKSPDIDQYLKRFPEHDRSKILWSIIENHLKTVLDHYKGKIFTWDAVNEPLATWGSGEFENNVYYRYLGEDYISRVFQLAHSIDPGLKLYLNEQFLSYTGKRPESFCLLIKKLKANNVPVNGVGIQSHVAKIDTSFRDFKTFIQRITDLGLEVEITELDARLVLFKSEKDPYQAQGQYYGKMLKACMDNALCKGITFWGFSDGRCWYDELPLFFSKPNEPYLFDGDMKPKPAFFVLYNMLKNSSEKRSDGHL